MRRIARILFLTLYHEPIGGMQIWDRQFVQTMRGLGQSVDVWSVFEACSTGASNQDTYIRMAPANSLLRRFYYRGWQLVLAIRLVQSLDKYDLIVCGHVHILPVLQRLKFKSTPYWICTYGREVWQRWSESVSFAMHRATMILTISNFTRDSIIRRLPGAEVYLVPPTVDIQRFRPMSIQRDNTEEKVVLTVGRISSDSRYKGHDVVIRALPRVKEMLGQEVVYWIAGTGDDVHRLQTLADALGVSNSVRFLGRIPDEDLARIYNMCDVFVMPSRMEKRPDGTWGGEGFGIVYIEAAACGKPVIAGNEGGAIDAVIHGTTGLTVDSSSVQAIADAICMLLEDDRLAAEMGHAGRQHVVENFSHPILRQKVANLLRKSGFATA